MKMHEIIKKRRLEKNLTQEQIAQFLGVSTPAVNKWEKGTSFPDITLLPPLARLLDTDLNTLLSFQEDLSEQEVALFMNHVSELYDNEGFHNAYTCAMKKVKEFPSCDLLILSCATLLQGMYMMEKPKPEKEILETIESLYERVLHSSNISIQQQARSMLISKYINQKDYEKAEQMLQMIPDKQPVDKKQKQIQLYMAKGNYEKAQKITQENLLMQANEIQTTLLTLLDIAIKTKQEEDSFYIAEVAKKNAEVLDLWEYISYLPLFQLYTAYKKPIKCMQVLIPMLKSFTHVKDISTSPLYRMIEVKKQDSTFAKKMQKTILQSIKDDEETAFLKNNKDFQTLLKQYSSEEDN